MVKRILLLLIFQILFSFSFLFSENYDFSKITSSTSFSQEIVKLSPSVEVITSDEIKLLGVENIPELLNLIPGINVSRINGATAEVAFRGMAPELRINPLILLDGMEIAEQFYSRNYIYNLPVLMDDIDKIEIIKDTSAFSNGYIAPGGIINIVTKQAQYLDNNNFSAIIGSNGLKNYNFSMNNYNFSTYWKITGKYRGIDDFEKSKRINKSKMINMSLDKYVGKGKLFLKAAISEQDLMFKESYNVGINHKEVNFSSYENLNNLLIKNILINYKFPGIDTSFYYQDLTGYANIRLVDSVKNCKFTNEFYKFSFRYNYKNLLSGFEYRYYHVRLKSVGSSYSYIFSPFFDFSVNIFKNIYFKSIVRNDSIKNNRFNLNYKLNFGYGSTDKTFNVNVGYSKSIKIPDLYTQYFHYKSSMPKEYINIPIINFNIPVNYHSNKNIKPIKIYTTDLTVSKKWNRFLFKTTLFYNRITDFINTVGIMKLVKFKPQIDFYNKNFMSYIIHGFEADIKYKFNKDFKMFASYYRQQIKNKTFNDKGNYFIPKYKINSGLLFRHPVLSGAITATYLPAVKSRDKRKSDYYLSVNTNLIKKFFKGKFEASLHIENLFNNIHREAYYGEKTDRMIFFKIKYNF